jgi:multiple sugar transport system substrate-binding protein
VGDRRRGAALRLGAAVLAGLLVLSGCAAGGGAPGAVTLTLLTHYANDPLKSGLQEMVDEWNASHPRVQVATQAVRYEDLLQTMTVRQAAGRGADIVQPYGLWAGQLARAGVLRPAPDAVAEEIRRDYSPAALGASSADGTVLGYPTEVQTYGLFYNRKILADAGVAAPPRTWAELEDVAVRTTERDQYGNVLVNGFGFTRGQDSSVVHPVLALLQAAGGSLLTRAGDRAAIDSSAGRAVLDLQHRLIARGAVDPAANVQKAFPADRVAMTINAGWWLGSLESTMGEDYRDVGVVPVPGPELGDRGSLAYGYFMGVNSQSEHPDEAWEFLRWLNAERAAPVDGGAQVSRMSDFQFSLGTVPARAADATVLFAGNTDPNKDPFHEALSYAMPEPNMRGGQKVKSLLQKNIEAMWTGQQSVSETLATATRQIDHELDAP